MIEEKEYDEFVIYPVVRTTNGTTLIPVWPLVGRRQAVQIRASIQNCPFFLGLQKNAAKINNDKEGGGE